MAAVVPDNVKNRHGGTEEVIPTLSVDEQGNYVAPGAAGGGAGDANAANQAIQITAEQAILASVGAVAGAAVITDANGTVQQYLRGLVKRWVDALGVGTATAALRTVHAAASGLATTQNALSTTAEEVIASNAARLFAEVKNADAAINIYLGDDNAVTAANGHLLKPGEAFGFDHFTGAVWAIAASGTPTVTTVEW